MTVPTDGEPEATRGRSPNEPVRHCAQCGEAFAADGVFCPNCGARWQPAGFVSVPALAALLSELRTMREGGLLDTATYDRVRIAYERRLDDARRQREAVSRGAPLASVALLPGAEAGQGAGSVPAGRAAVATEDFTPAAAQRAASVPGAPSSAPARPPPLKPPKPPGPTFGEWASARQADILLYLGAFVLAIAALSFLNYQGSALGGAGRCAVLLAFTVTFLAGGLLLPRWERVHEAAPLFLALGAILTPLNAVAWQTQLGGGAIPDEWLWLLGSGLTAALYFGLALRGHGAWYAGPGALAAVVAWGALGVVLHLPDEWFGAWFVGAAAALHIGVVAAGARLSGVAERLASTVSIIVGMLALLFAHLAAALSAHDRLLIAAQLPASYAFATAAIALHARQRRSATALAWLAPALTMLAGSLWWALLSLAPGWESLFPISVAGGGFLLIAERDADGLQQRWRGKAAVALAVGLLIAHAEAADAGRGESRFLPAAYGAALLLAAWDSYRRRDLALLTLPALATMLAGTIWWNAGAPLEWLALFPILVGGGGYLALAEGRWPGLRRIQARLIERAPAELGARLTPQFVERLFASAATLIGLLLAHEAAGRLGGSESGWYLPAAYAGALLLAGWDAFRRRDGALLPPLAMMLAATGWWAAYGLPREWLGFFPTLLAGGGYLLLAELDTAAGRQRRWRLLAAASGGVGLALAHGGALETRGWFLPATDAIALLGVAWDSYRRRDPPPLLALPALAALTAGAGIWAAGKPMVWTAYPILDAAAAVQLLEWWWRRRPVLRAVGWPYLLIPTALTPLLYTPLIDGHPLHGIALFGGAAAIILPSALHTRGALARLVTPQPSAGILALERQTLARVGSAYLYATAAYIVQWFGWRGPDRAWAYAGLGFAAWLGLAAAGRSRRELYGVLAPVAVTGTLIAGWLGWESAGIAAAVLSLGALGPTPAFASVRRWPLWGVAALFGSLALARAGEWRGLDSSSVVLIYTALAAAVTVGLTQIRRYEPDERGHTITTLSWLPLGVALTVAAVLLEQRRDAPSADPLVRSREWATLAAAVATAALALTAEGWRLGRRLVAAAGTGGLLLALLLAIAILQPGNVQAFTLPAGFYFIALGLAFRRSPALLGAALSLGEAAVVLGVLLLILPPAAQSLAPGGARYGLEEIALGLALLTVGLALAARWLVVGGVLTLSAVALRWLGSDAHLPYWVTLGLLGIALLGFGLLLLLERERWERARARLGRWWIDSATA